MKQTIRFRGLSLNKDEQSAQHGELALCGNVELHDGALRPYQVDGEILAGGDTNIGEILYVHVTASYTHFITRKSGGLYWTKESYAKDSASHDLYVGKVSNVDTDVYQDGSDWRKSHDAETGADTLVTIDAGTTPVRKKAWSTETLIVVNATLDTTTIRSIKSVGNTLCIMNAGGLYYILCKNDGNGWKYKYLGQHPPFLDLQFSLTGVSTGDTNNDRVSISTGGLGDGVVPEDKQSSVTEKVMALVNKRLSDITDEGLFYAPFFVRYCYRMFDRSMVMHSSPVFLFPCLKHPVMNSGENLDDSDQPNEGVDVVGVAIFFIGCKLRVIRLNDDNYVKSLKEWSDIIKSVDIFVTPQFSRIDTSKPIKTFSKSYEDNDVKSILGGYEYDVAAQFESQYYGSFFKTNLWGFDLPEYSESIYFDRIKNASAFFRLASFSIETIDTDFTTSFADLKFDKDVFKNITIQEQMTDDYKTHNILMPASEEYGSLYVYNHRLNVTGISEKLFMGFIPSTMFPYAESGAAGMVDVTSVVVWVNTTSGLRKLVINAPSGQPWTVPEWFMNEGYCFYPDDRAVFIAFRHDTLSEFGLWKIRKLTPASALNGSISFMDEGDSNVPTYLDNASTDRIIPLMNKVYTSRADNPFYFPNLPGESGINSVGTGNIIGIAAVTRPLVQGEVGRQNLVVFATDGIWVLEVSPTGTYQNMRNLSREVCVNQESICQMDQSILFATNRSLSRFVESDVVSVSEVLDGPLFDIRTKMPAFDAFADTLSFNWGLKMSVLTRFDTPPLDFFREGKELYDYTGMRVIVFPKDMGAGGVALVYSIRDGAWSTIMYPPLRTVINSYPTPYIQRADGLVFCLNQAYDYKAGYTTPGVVLTRTLTFSDTMDVLRGFRQYTDAATMPLVFFYGSNDQRTWNYIGRSSRSFSNYIPGHPYRFFRIGFFTNMYPSEEYQQMELEIINKYAKL